MLQLVIEICYSFPIGCALVVRVYNKTVSFTIFYCKYRYSEIYFEGNIIQYLKKFSYNETKPSKLAGFLMFTH